MKYYIIAGEASGDLHGSNLMKALLKARQQSRNKVLGWRFNEYGWWNSCKTL